MPESTIDSIRIHVSFSLRQLLSSDILGEVPHTEEFFSSHLHSALVSETPVRVMAFSGAVRPFPLFKTSMVLTAVVTMYTLQLLSPLNAAEKVGAGDTVSELYVSMPNHPPLLPEEPLHAAAEEVLVAPSSESVSSENPLSDAINPKPVMRADSTRGVFLTASSAADEEFLSDTISELLASGGDSIVFDVKGGGVPFRSAASIATEIGIVKNLYDLPTIIKKLHDNDIYVIGRFVAIKDEAFTRKMPDTRIKNPITGNVLSQTWIDPANETAIEYNMQVMCELAAAGIDEVNLDYIRFSTAEFGALGVFSGEEKADRVETFIAAARDTINRCGPDTKLGISTYAILGWNYDVNVATLGQDVRRFAPLVDVISPMAYPATFTSPAYYNPGVNPGPRMYWLVYRTLTGYRDLLGPEESRKIRPWIQGYGVQAADVSHQIRGVYDAGFCGFQVWNAQNSYGPTYRAMEKDDARPPTCEDDVGQGDFLSAGQ